MSRGQVAYFDQRADRAALASQTTPNSDIPFIKYKKVSRLRRNYPQNALFPTPYIGGKVPELTGTHRNSPGTTPGTHPGTHPWNLACSMVLSWVLVWLGQPSLFFLIAACKHKTIAHSVSLSLSLSDGGRLADVTPFFDDHFPPSSLLLFFSPSLPLFVVVNRRRLVPSPGGRSVRAATRPFAEHSVAPLSSNDREL